MFSKIRKLGLRICLLYLIATPVFSIAQSKDLANQLVLYAAQGDINAVQRALASGISVNNADSIHQATALHAAAAVGHIRLIELLIDKGADLNALDRRGITPLIIACATGQISSAKALIKAGADISIKPALAPTALIVAIQTGNAQLVETLLLAKANVDQSDIFGTTPLQAALLTKRENIIKQVGQGLSRNQ
jgi:ankyrin repeat protein